MVAVQEDVKLKDAVRTARFEVYRIEADDPKPVWQRWHDASRQVQEITNRVWQAWFVWHYQHGSIEKIREYLDALKAWRQPNVDWERDRTEAHRQHVAYEKAELAAGRKPKKFKFRPAPKLGKKPKLNLFAIDAECAKFIYDELAARFPHINTNVREGVRQMVSEKIKERKAAKGSLSAWMAILLCRENMPSSRRSVPVPVPNKSAEIIPPIKSGGNFRVRLRLDRIVLDGKKNGVSTVDELQLLTKRRGIVAYEKILHRLVTGEWHFSNLSLQYDERQKKWFCLVAYKMPVGGERVEGNKTAYLYPNEADAESPWTLEIDDRQHPRGGRGNDVAHVRRTLLTNRWDRQETYRRAGSANKGHGRKRALQPIERLSNRWKDFVKTKNQQLASDIVNDCLRGGCGFLVYRQPTGATRGKMMLEQAGKDPKRRDATGWDWFQVKNCLGHKCQAAGIHLVVEKMGEEEDDAEAA